MRYTLMMLALAWATGTARAQEDAIPWLTEPQRAVSEAKGSLRPLMVYVLASNKDRDPKLDHEQKLALNDPRVVRLSQRFVPLRLSRSIHRDVLSSFGLSERANMEMSFVTPDGELLGSLSAGGVAQASSLASKLLLVFDAYVKKLHQTQVKPVLDDPNAKPEDLKQALRVATTFYMTVAESEIIALLERPRLDVAVREEAYDALAALSTKGGVAKLLECARGEDARAAKALAKCTPVGAEHLLSELSPDAEEVDYPVYKTAAQICGVHSVKPKKFFENAKPRLKKEEVERVCRLVHEAAERWKEMHDEPH